jgi:hypothetical protein
LISYYAPKKYLSKADVARIDQAILKRIIVGNVFLVDDHIKASDEIKAKI